MVDTVEFYPVEVTKPFMSLAVGDVLRLNPKNGRYELKQESEDIADKSYSYFGSEISLEPWIIEKYYDHFQIHEEKELEKPEDVHKYPLTEEETYPCDECEKQPSEEKELEQVVNEEKENVSHHLDVIYEAIVSLREETTAINRNISDIQNTLLTKQDKKVSSKKKSTRK